VIARRWLPLVAAVVAMVVVIGTFVVIDRSNRPADPADPAEPAEPADPGERTSGEARLRAVVADLEDFVEAERGISFEEPVDVELLDGDAFERRLLDNFEEDDRESVAELAGTMRALGVIEPGDDLVALYEDLLSAVVLGFYDAEDDELVVRGGDLGPYVRQTIAHELVHALDDQHYDLDRPEYDDADDEIGFGFSALAEGSAREVELAYRRSLSADQRDRLAQEEQEFALAATDRVLQLPRLLLELLNAAYVEGAELRDVLYDLGGEARFASAMAAPPRTSEAVIEPQRYLDGEGAVEVRHPRADGEIVSDGVVGQLFLHLLLSGAIGEERARDASIGWGGDWYVQWDDGERSCVRMAIVGDTASDTDELGEAFERWADEQPDASVETADEVTVTACV
jgi:hypothetical protein